MFDRRQMLLGMAASGFTLSSACSQSSNIQVGSRSIEQVGIQTYTLREIFKNDPVETLKLIRNVGYDYVELNRSNFQQVEPVELKSMLKDIGLDSPASHISLEMLNDLPKLIEVSKILGFKYVIVPYIADDKRRLEDWKYHAELMNQAGKQLRDEGIRLAYHNHQFEFDDLGGGTTAMEILLNGPASENLCFELDLFWASLAGADIPDLFKMYPDRFKLCHIKDMGFDREKYLDAEYETITRDLIKNVGEGILDFESMFALNDISGMEYFIAEHDQPPRPYKGSIQMTLQAIKDMRF